MTKFEEVGVEFQLNSRTIGWANKSFEYSCEVCCRKGIHIKCSHCAIAEMNALVIAALKSIGGKEKGEKK